MLDKIHLRLFTATEAEPIKGGFRFKAADGTERRIRAHRLVGVERIEGGWRVLHISGDIPVLPKALRKPV